MHLLTAYDYPGNVRELRNLLERASLLCDGGELRPGHLAEELRDGSGGAMTAGGAAAKVRAPETWDEIQLQALREVAAAHRGTRRALARKLSLSERTLYRRLAEMKTGDGEAAG